MFSGLRTDTGGSARVDEGTARRVVEEVVFVYCAINAHLKYVLVGEC